MITIRPEQPADAGPIRRLNEKAFGQPNEADLVDALRDQGALILSLVAEEDGRIIGHIAFSPVTVRSEAGCFTALGLAPMAVAPERQRSGVGSQLVRAGLDECQRTGYLIIVVLGHPDYYRRFGFVPSRPLGIQCEYDVPEDVFMVAELSPGALAGRGGVVSYHSAFNSI